MKKTDKRLFKTFVSYYKPHKTVFFLDMLCAFIYSTCGLVYPIISRELLNNYIPNGKYTELIIFCSVLIGIYVIRASMKYFENYYGHVMGVKMQATMRADLFKHLQKLPYSFYDNNETGQLMTRMTNDIFEVAELAHHGPENLFIATFMTVGAFIYLCIINWMLALILIVFFPILVFIALYTRKELLLSFKKSREKVGDINAVIENSIAGIRVTKAYASEQKEQVKFDETNKAYVSVRCRAYKALGKYGASMAFITEIYNVIVLLAGGLFLLYKVNDFNYADLVAFMISINLFIAPIQTLIQFLEQFQDGVTGFRRYIQILDEKAEEDATEVVDIKSIEGNIELKNINFGYDEQDNVLKDINISIPKGKIYAFVGESGGGKTSICHLIPKFYTPHSGTITIDGININNIPNEILRKNIGIVQQDVFLFTGTFKDNITTGKPNATEEEIISAAKLAGIHDFIMDHQDGYDTQIGERGVKLSGGQKQRLSIARVFLKNPSILILDEATSALDNTTEAQIQKSLNELCKGRTTLVVAHRLSTVRNADKIVVIEHGKIKETGTHSELLEQNGIYARLYNSTKF